MAWANDAEVTTIEGRYLADRKAFGGRDYGGVDGAEGKITVAGDELGDPQQVLWLKWLDDEVGGEIAQEAHLCLPAQTCAEQVADLGDNECGYDQRAGVGFQQLQTGSVMSIICVYIGVERPSVDDQRDVASSALMISSTRSEMLLRPLRPAADAPRRCRLPAPR